MGYLANGETSSFLVHLEKESEFHILYSLFKKTKKKRNKKKIAKRIDSLVKGEVDQNSTSIKTIYHIVFHIILYPMGRGFFNFSRYRLNNHQHIFNYSGWCKYPSRKLSIRSNSYFYWCCFG